VDQVAPVPLVIPAPPMTRKLALVEGHVQHAREVDLKAVGALAPWSHDPRARVARGEGLQARPRVVARRRQARTGAGVQIGEQRSRVLVLERQHRRCGRQRVRRRR
jgi:hypothetical protein